MRLYRLFGFAATIRAIVLLAIGKLATVIDSLVVHELLAMTHNSICSEIAARKFFSRSQQLHMISLVSLSNRLLAIEKSLFRSQKRESLRELSFVSEFQ